MRGPYCFCVTLCLAAAQCTTAAALRSCASTGHHTHHTHSWSRDAGDPTVSTPATVTYIVRIAQLLPWRMKELLNSKPLVLHLERPLGPMLPCPAAWPEQWPHAALATTSHHNTPHCHNYSHLTVLLLRTFGASTNNMDTKKESNMSSRVCPCCTYNNTI